MIELPTPETDALFYRNGYPVVVDSSKVMQLCEKLEQERDWITEKFKLLEGCFKRAERERDEAMEEIKEWKTLCLWGGTPEHIHGFIRGQQSRIQHLERERDEAREKIERQADIGCSFQKTNPAMCGRYKQERDEAREKYATEATEHMLAINKLCNERDEAVEALNKILKNE